MGSVTNDWLPVIEEETKKDYYKKLYLFLKDEFIEMPRFFLINYLP